MMTYIILIATVVVSIACFNNYSLFNKLSCNPYIPESGTGLFLMVLFMLIGRT